MRADEDLIQPFLIDSAGIHGRLVRLGPVVDSILSAHDYARPVAGLLGESLALTAGLAGALKYDGVFSMQMKGNGPVHMLVADVTTDGDMRGYARAREEVPDRTGGAPIPRLLGAGHIAFTVDQGPESERYQGIVDLQGATLADCVHHFFRQSDQFSAAVRLASGRCVETGRWRAGALILQRLPADENPLIAERHEDDWRRMLMLMGTCRDDELIGTSTNPYELLYRLFHEEGVRVFDTRPVRHGCRCSRERMASVLTMLSQGELAELTVEGVLRVTCEFCSAEEVFSPAEIASRSGDDAAAAESDGSRD